MSHHLIVPLAALTPDQRQRWLTKQMQKVEAMAQRERDRRAELEDTDYHKSLRNTKPLIYVDKHPDWPIVVVGGGAMFREDMREMARKRRDYPRYKEGRPRVQFPDPNETLRTIVDQHKRDRVGMRTFHIPNNPLWRGV